MDKKTTEEFRVAVATRINIPVTAYMEARLEDVKAQMISCVEERMLRMLQGRAQELMEILKELKSVRE